MRASESRSGQHPFRIGTRHRHRRRPACRPTRRPPIRIQERSEGPTGGVPATASPVLGLAWGHRSAGYPLVLVGGCITAQSTGDWDVVDQLCRQALEDEEARRGARQTDRNGRLQPAGSEPRPWPVHIRRNLGYTPVQRNLRSPMAFQGLAAIFLSYTVDCGLLGGTNDEEVCRRPRNRSRWPGNPVCREQSHEP